MYNRNLCNGLKLQAGVNMASVFVAPQDHHWNEV